MSTISSSLPTQLPVRAAATKPAPAPAPAPAPPKPHDITILQAVEGIASGVAVAGIETVGNTAASLMREPSAIYHSYKALINTPQFGPVLKTCIGIMLPVGAIAAPILTAIGSAGFGLIRGFSTSIDKGMGGAIKEGGQDVKYFYKDMAGQLTTSLEKFETEPLKPGQKPYEINLLGGGKGIGSAVIGGVVDGASMGAITLAKTPKGAYKAFKEIWKSNQGPVLKTCETLLVPPAIILATPLAAVGGVVYGAATSFKESYTNGFTSGVKKSVDNVKDFNKVTTEILKG